MSRVLITNDDGIAAPGLRHLALAAVEAGHEVVVAAPATEASGMGTALTAYTDSDRVVVERQQLDGLADLPSYGVAASPSYIVIMAMAGAFGEVPDVVFSGINRGANAGRAVLHSGTVGAAFAAATYRVPALAVSLDVLSPLDPASGGNRLTVLDSMADASHNWASAAAYIRDVLPGLRDGWVLNLNVPDLPADKILGLKKATLAEFGQVQMAIAETGSDFVRVALEEHGGQHASGSDLAWLRDGYATYTAVRAVGVDEGFNLP
ncbi:5'/3'-nucleotidase SurE [Kribbella sp. NBC_01245]|uniref:5'/3'-nucleotidase SurE n=1 Tax=Kribbella sp. NBC_01245 TaxID=2903578 RepID=UPI002E2D7211|nr:5'/3'-nucleotidase SurE [Kribbella sp. NBC_01245]